MSSHVLMKGYPFLIFLVSITILKDIEYATII